LGDLPLLIVGTHPHQVSALRDEASLGVCAIPVDLMTACPPISLPVKEADEATRQGEDRNFRLGTGG
jgi:hypothetical protein